MHVFIFLILAGYSYIRSHSNLYIKKKCEEDDKPEIKLTNKNTDFSFGTQIRGGKCHFIFITIM